MRKTSEITINVEGRDKGKVFLITEMSAFKAEKWAARALLAVTHGGLQIPPEMLKSGMQAMAVLGLKMLSNLQWETAEPLLDEMMSCVQVKETAVVRDVTEDDIEEAATILKLRDEVFKLHTGFSFADTDLNSILAPVAAKDL